MEEHLLQHCPRSLVGDASPLRLKVSKSFHKFNYSKSFQTFRIIQNVFKHLENLSNLTSTELLSFRCPPVLGRGGVGGVVRVSNEAAYLIKFDLF